MFRRPARWRPGATRARPPGCPARIPATRVPVEAAAGLVTAGPVWAVRSSPPFDAAGMDGIAVRAADTLGASETTPVWLPADAYDVVDTGDPIPDGRDAVVMREHVHYQGDAAEIRGAVPPYQHVRSIGEDVSAGELLLTEGHRLRAADLAAAAAAGATHLLVRRRPVVTILPTGDEVRPIGAETGAGEITDTNSLMLATQAREAGCEARCLPIEPDDPERIAYAVKAAASALRAEDPMVTLASSNVGSLGGLVALRDGLCHLVGSHLLDPASGEYTLPYLDRVLAPRGGAEVSVVRLVHRDQGLMVAPGNPLGLTGIGDLTRAGVRYVNRQRGAGTRVLLDFELGRLGVSPDDVRRLRPGGADAPGGGRGRRRGPRGRGPGHHGGGPRVRPGFRPGHPGALRSGGGGRRHGQPAARPAVVTAPLRPLPGGGHRTRRLRHQGNGPPHPVKGPSGGGPGPRPSAVVIYVSMGWLRREPR